ncbi:hypothetical protein CVS40_9010 [Lucilia cuprina]|nr:hypothetical protein CVS40_9010 [Lucilia cuprina]
MLGGGGGGDGGDDTSSVTICGSSSSTINSHCFNTHHTPSPTILASTSPHEQFNNNSNTTTTITTSASNTNGSTTNTQFMDYKTTKDDIEGVSGDVNDATDAEEQPLGCGIIKDHNNIDNNTTICAANSGLALQNYSQHTQTQQQPETQAKNLLLCRRFKDSSDSLRNFTSLPLFIYATSPSTHATSADGVGVAQVAVKAAEEAVANMKKNEAHDLIRRNSNSATTQQQTSKSNSSVSSSGDGLLLRRAMDCLPLTHGVGTHHPHLMASSNTVNVTVAPSSAVVAAYPHHHHLNLNHHHLLSHHLPYSNNYSGLHHTSTTSSNSHHHNHPHLNIHSEQTKSLQELQHEVGALLEFRDLVIETFPDLKQKMASISSAASTSSSTGGGVGSGNVMTNGQSSSVSVSSSGSTIPLTSGGTLVSRREWEPGIRVKRKISQKEQPAAIELTSSSSLTRSRSNSHSGKKEPKSSSGGGAVVSGSGGATSGGENNNGSVVQDSGFSTETSSSKEGHSASSTNGALTGAIASNRLSCPESDDELLNLLDVIHRKSNRLREEVEHLQNYERQHLQPSSSAERDHPDVTTSSAEGATGLSKSSSSSANTALTPKTFREHVERLNKEDLQQLRKERDRLLDKLAEMEAETLTGRIKAAKMSEQVEELINVKRDLEEQLKLAMAQRLELNSRVQQLQQQQLTQSKSSNSQSDFSSSPRTFLSSSANTVLSTVSANSSRQNTFQPVVVEQQTTDQQQHNHLIPFHQSIGSDNKRNSQQQQFSPDQLGRLDGIVSTPGDRNAKCRVTDSKRFAAILLETSVIELRRHLLTLTVKNQVLMQKLDQASKTKGHLVKRLDKSKEDVEDLRFQLEEKNIELEGTKAQLRVLESRLHSITPSSGAATNSYLHSQNDYETNRSSASTTLMLSRRGGGGGVGSGLNTDSSDIRSSTPISASTHNGQMPQPITMQISTPSMKAMTHLPMDDMQHHSSSTESAHEHDVVHHETMTISQMQTKLENGRNIRQAIMSTSVDGVSPFEQQLQQQQVAAIRNQVQALKKFSGVTATKPSKIPLPGSKAAAYFAGKPPSGRPSTAGRSPPSANSSGSSSRSPLSRSTGNLLYSKSPNSLKRADSAQSIRKDNNSSSLSTNTSRSSTSSSIPMATTSYGSASKSYVGGGGGGNGSISNNNHNTTSNNTLNSPSSRILQNSPLPKPKRESLSTKVRHMDSLSRAYHHQHNNTTHNYSNISNTSDNTPTTIVQSNTSPTTATTPGGGNGAGSYLISSTPKTSTIAAQLTSSLRKDLQLSSSSFNHPAPFQRRATASSAVQSNSNNSNTQTTRRFSSASVMGARSARQASQDYEGQHNSNVSGNSVAAGVISSSSSTHSGGVNNGGTASDSDSGKNLNYYFCNYHHYLYYFGIFYFYCQLFTCKYFILFKE